MKEQAADLAASVLKSKGSITFPTTGEQIGDIVKFTDDEDLNLLLNKVHWLTMEKLLRAIPELIKNRMEEDIILRREAMRFFENNGDLLEHSPLLSMVANEVQAEHPDWNVREVFEEAGKRARLRLDGQKKAEKIYGQGT